MYTDIFGKKRAKLGLHIHTTNSDGAFTPEQAAEKYKSEGYDMIALTDHWVYGEGGEINGLPVISGCEYHFGDTLQGDPIYHIVALGMKEDPTIYAPDITMDVNPELVSYKKVNIFADAIKKAGGLTVLAHPAWSMNDTIQISRLEGIEATEIYNTVSECGMSDRPYSGCVIDSLACMGTMLPLLAVDDVHYYTDDCCVAYIMAELEELNSECVLKAIRECKFYATQGPEIHLYREDNGSFTVKTTPVDKISFFTNRGWAPNRVWKGDGITEAHFDVVEGESFIRAEAKDKNGKTAWSNIIRLG